MRAHKIISIVCLIIGVTLMLGSGLHMFQAGIDLPSVIHGSGGSILSTISFSGITNPQEIGYIDGDEAMGGNGVVAYLAFRSDISEFPAEISAPTSLAEAVLLTGNYVMKTNKYFIQILVPADTLSDDNDIQGENGGESFKNKGVFKFPGKGAEKRGFARRVKGSQCVLIIPSDEGYRINYGTANRPVTVKPAGKSGVKAADFKGFEYSWESDSLAPGYTYNGSIPLSATVTLDPIS